MDHRWDERVRQGRAAEVERERYRTPRVARDEDVERRDRIAAARRAPGYSPWEIGAAHWDQRDLYTRDARTEPAGYGHGPAAHPEVGSYAYPRPPSNRPPPGPPPEESHEELYAREAWPWLNYHAPEPPPPPPLWERMKERLGLTRGEHTGRGPKNFQRSDERIREDVWDALAYDGALDASDIEVEVAKAEVTLRGTVPDRASKRRAEELAERCLAVRDVHNRLEIQPPDPRDTDAVLAMSGLAGAT